MSQRDCAILGIIYSQLVSWPTCGGQFVPSLKYLASAISKIVVAYHDHYCRLYRHYVAGYRTLIANEAIENEPSAVVGEWMSAILKPYATGSSVACLILDLKSEFIKRINVELIYQDGNDTIQKTSLFDYECDTRIEQYLTPSDELSLKEYFGTYEFHLDNVLQYQV